MNWDAIGAIAELLGSVTVLITLLYLAVQVKNSKDLLEENKKLAQSQAYQNRADFRREVHVAFTQPNFAKAAAKISEGRDGPPTKVHLDNFERLPLEDQYYYRNTIAQWAVMMDNALMQIELGMFDDDARESAEGFIRSNYAWWLALDIGMPSKLRKWCIENGVPEELGT